MPLKAGDGQSCIDGTDCFPTTVAMDTVRFSERAAGRVQEVQFESGTVTRGLKVTFDGTTRASEVRLVSRGNGTATLHAAAIVVAAGAPLLRLHGLRFTGSAQTPALTLRGGNVDIQNCMFDSNSASVVHLDGGTLHVEDSMFTFNGWEATDVAADRQRRKMQASTVPVSTTVVEKGGAISVDTGHLTVIRSSFYGNRAAFGGAIHVEHSARLTIRHTTFEANQATNRGGAIDVAGPAELLLSNQTQMIDNSAPTGSSLYLAQRQTAWYILPAARGTWVPSTFRCDAQSFDARCSPQLYGASIMAFHRGPTDSDFPLLCAAGLVGSSLDAEHQSSPKCAGYCPPGYFCPSGTVVPQECVVGAYCELASPAPVLCPHGTYGTRVGLKSAKECLQCGARYSD